MTAGAVARMVVVGFTVAALQALLLDTADFALIRYLDLPLVLVVVLVLVRPADAVTAGFVIGLAVDAFHGRLFGLHGLAYAVLDPVAAAVPVGALRSRVEAVGLQAGAQAVVAVNVIVAGVTISGGRFPTDLLGRYVQTTAWVLITAVPVVLGLDGRAGVLGTEPPGAAGLSTRDPVVPLRQSGSRSRR